MNIEKEFIPFVEKYRPTNFDDIVLDPLNRQILKTIIETSYFPNLLFYGPPGTGKTSSIINLISAYQKHLNINGNGLTIHLNASDERGIDIIRNQISSFVNAKPLFKTGMKFVILDEVDYMTKNAQQALKYLLQNYSSTVRFCLICNYISRIDEGLQNEFLRLKFNQLPECEITNFIRNVSISENLNLSDENIKAIQRLYKSDIRSMLNFIQSNQYLLVDNNKLNIVDNNVWSDFFDKIKTITKLEDLNKYIYNISVQYNIDKKNIIKDFLNYIIRMKQTCVTTEFLKFVENLTHTQDCKNTHYVDYSLSMLMKFVK
jgi:DNA polymerase III delta prime subunit